MEQTQDEVFGGVACIVQHKSGYRFTADALWLAATAAPLARGEVVDLGAGTGVVGLCLAAASSVSRVYLVEKQAALAALAKKSVELSQPRCPVVVVQSDLRQLRSQQNAPDQVQLVVANPPFFAADQARPAACKEQDRARRALSGDVADFSRVAQGLLRSGGNFVLVYPARFITRALHALQSAQLGLRSLRFIHARADLTARLVVLCAKKGAKDDIEVLPPWIEHDDGGETQAAAMLRDPDFFS